MRFLPHGSLPPPPAPRRNASRERLRLLLADAGSRVLESGGRRLLAAAGSVRLDAGTGAQRLAPPGLRGVAARDRAAGILFALATFQGRAGGSDETWRNPAIAKAAAGAFRELGAALRDLPDLAAGRPPLPEHEAQAALTCVCRGAVRVLRSLDVPWFWKPAGTVAAALPETPEDGRQIRAGWVAFCESLAAEAMAEPSYGLPVIASVACEGEAAARPGRPNGVPALSLGLSRGFAALRQRGAPGGAPVHARAFLDAGFRSSWAWGKGIASAAVRGGAALASAAGRSMPLAGAVPALGAVPAVGGRAVPTVPARTSPSASVRRGSRAAARPLWQGLMVAAGVGGTLVGFAFLPFGPLACFAILAAGGAMLVLASSLPDRGGRSATSGRSRRPSAAPVPTPGRLPARPNRQAREAGGHSPPDRVAAASTAL